jgi:sterol desaturase/sphingolipid hydroxylase (fatty acid hydroxylase superfamily)
MKQSGMDDAGAAGRSSAADTRPALAAAPGGKASLLARLSASRINAQLGLFFDVAVALLLLVIGLRVRHASVPALLVFLAGLGLFTFVEYAFHRWLFHGAVALFEQGHTRHHEQPQGHDALPFFFPPLAMLALAGCAHLLVDAGDAYLLAAAIATGYALYGLSHSIIHARRFRSRNARRWAGAHHVHHYHPHTNFGVTTPFWDIVFGTRHVSRRRDGVA